MKNKTSLFYKQLGKAKARDIPEIINHHNWIEIKNKILQLLPPIFRDKIERKLDWKFGFLEGELTRNTVLILDQHLKGLPSLKSDDELRKIATKKRDYLMEVLAGQSEDQQLQGFLTLCKIEKVKPPQRTNRSTQQSIIQRAFDEKWWYKRLRQAQDERIESVAVAAGLVSCKKELYLSNESFYKNRDRRKNNADFLEKTIALNDQDQEFTLKQIAKSGMANPRVRRAEMMTRIGHKGFEQMARDLGHSWEFWTITTPSRMHSQTRLSPNKSADNINYDGTSPKQAQQYLCKLWSKARAKFKRQGINIYGFRVAEPHHDGTPHWHLLVFETRENIVKARDIMRSYAMEDSPDEAGANVARFKYVLPLEKFGNSPAGYIAKYIAKNLPSEEDKFDLFGDPDYRSKSERSEAWSRIWGIRQFQQIGGSPVGVWRELRRLKPEDLSGKPENFIELVKMADSGDWSGYCRNYDKSKADLFKHSYTNKYSEVIDKVVGLLNYNYGAIITRLHQWLILPKRVVETLKKIKDYQLSQDLPEWFSNYMRGQQMRV